MHPRPGEQFDRAAFARGGVLLDKVFRKARHKSGGDVLAARGRLLLYSQRDPAVRRELARRAIWQAAFSVAVTGEFPAPGAVPEDMDPHPFTAPDFAAMRNLVQRAADAALSGAGGDVAAARAAMWAYAVARPELASALAGLMILALR